MADCNHSICAYSPVCLLSTEPPKKAKEEKVVETKPLKTVIPTAKKKVAEKKTAKKKSTKKGNK